MIGLGTIINTVAVIAGGLIGHFAGGLFKKEQQEALNRVCGVSVLFIAIAGAMEGNQVSAGLHHRSDDDFLHGKGKRLFSNSDISL